jgi:hypothetical protein
MNQKRPALKTDILPTGSLSLGGSEANEQAKDDPSQSAGPSGCGQEKGAGLINAQNARWPGLWWKWLCYRLKRSSVDQSALDGERKKGAQAVARRLLASR